MMKIESIESEDQRPDQTPKLGTELFDEEDKCYNLIYQNGLTPIPNFKIFYGMDEYFKKEKPTTEYINGSVDGLIDRIRKKLGDKAIIYIEGFGYIAQSQLINYMVMDGSFFNENKEQE